jgi:hypothetical protein
LLLQGRRLHTSPALEHAQTLVKEMENFRVKITAAMKETFESVREGLHDDLVLAAAMAAWVGESVYAAELRRVKALAEESRQQLDGAWGWQRLT